MKPNSLLQTAITACCLMALTSCGDEPVRTDSAHGLVTVKFVSTITATSKATDTSFEPGDKVLVFTNSLTKSTMYGLTYSASGEFAYDDPENPITKQADESLRYLAIYPNNDSNTSDVIIINDHTLDLAGGFVDICIADEQTSASTVNLRFGHMLSKLCVKVLNAPAAVNGISLCDLKPYYRIDINGDTEAYGTELSSVSMRHDASLGEYPWLYYVAPLNYMDSNTTILRISLANGETVDVTAPESDYFAPGKAYYWSVDLSSISPRLSGEIADWE